MLDLGKTLIHKTAGGDYEPFPHVHSAIDELNRIRCQDGTQAYTCLVSDFGDASTPADIPKEFAKFIEILERVGFRGRFEPVEERVTLSTHAGVKKPDPRLFDLALQRLGSKASFSECLFITEEAGHIAACLALGMDTLHFGLPEDQGGFQDWSRATGIISAHVSR